jgi:hypothetical protein
LRGINLKNFFRLNLNPARITYLAASSKVAFFVVRACFIQLLLRQFLIAELRPRIANQSLPGPAIRPPYEPSASVAEPNTLFGIRYNEGSRMLT